MFFRGFRYTSVSYRIDVFLLYDQPGRQISQMRSALYSTKLPFNFTKASMMSYQKGDLKHNLYHPIKKEQALHYLNTYTS